jgi:hypothetical protein
MAFADAAFGMTVTFIDSGSNTASREYMMDDAQVTTFAEAQAAAVAAIPIIQALSDAPIASYRVFQNYNEAALVLPLAIQIENTMSLTYQLSLAGNKKANINVPAPKITMFVSSTGPQSNVVNTNAATNVPLDTFSGLFITSGNFTISDGEKTTRILSGKRVHRKSSRG